MPEKQLPNLQQMDRDISKLLELGSIVTFLKKFFIYAEWARDLVKGLLYLKERFGKDNE